MKLWKQNFLKYKGCLLLIDFTHDNCKNLIDSYYFEYIKRLEEGMQEIPLVLLEKLIKLDAMCLLEHKP